MNTERRPSSLIPRVGLARPNLETLDRFFRELRAVTQPRPAASSMASSLEIFFAQFAELRPLLADQKPVLRSRNNDPSPDRLISFFRDYYPIARVAARLGDMINVWEVAGLKRNELRNAAVLAWLFDPHETHGCGADIFLGFLRLIEARKGKSRLSTSIGNNYVVLREAYLLDNMESRVDVAIEGSCLVIIEAKIDAVPDKQQILDYLSIAERRARNRPYCVILLAPAHPIFGIDNQYFVTATWNDVSETIEGLVRQNAPSSSGFGDRVLKQFARYIRKF
jgi:hypothetical protein